jgi:hypothetical protein
MNANNSDLNGIDIVSKIFMRFNDFEVSWAGPGRCTGEFAFGSEDGRILITDEDLKPIALVKSPLNHSESINGLVFQDDWISLTTRCEVAFVSRGQVNGKHLRAIIPAGAHELITTASGYCVAPLGPGGIMVIKPSAGKYQNATILKSASDQPLIFYKVVSIADAAGEVLVCATRSDGVTAMPLFSNEPGFIRSFSYPGLDVVDVCSLGDNLGTPAIGAIGRDCTIILMRDALNDPMPTTISFPEIKEVAYRLMNHKGHLLLLTNKAVHVLSGLGSRFLEGQPVAFELTPTRTLFLDAVDANIVDDRYLLVVTPTGVIRQELDSLISMQSIDELPANAKNYSAIEMSPPWHPERNSLVSESVMMESAA